MQIGEIHRLAVEPETPGKYSNAEAGQYYRPALTEFSLCGDDGYITHALKLGCVAIGHKRFFMALSEEKF